MEQGVFHVPGLPFDFATPLGLTAWAVLAGVPVAIVALYFLKLRRKPVQVPSTLLWRRSLEDLHVNSLFQRLRRNLLLFLQLLIVFLVMLALLGPRSIGSSGQGQLYVIAIDNSASMGAKDVAPTRLARAQAEARKLLDGMESNDLAMVIAFADSARVVSNYTSDKRLLRQRIDAIEPTDASTSLREALQVAAGLANPSKQVGEGVVAAAVKTPKLKIYTDGGFADVDGFSLGNLEPEVIVLGPAPPAYVPPTPGDATSSRAKSLGASDNIAILALQTRRNEEKTDMIQLFGRVRNYRGEDVATEAKLYRRDAEQPGGAPTLVDAASLKIPALSERSFEFDIPDTGAAELEVRIDDEDALAIDNRAYAVVGSPRKAQVLVVTPGNKYLVDTLKTSTAAERADVVVINAEQVKQDPFARDLKSGRYDLVIFDQFRPESDPQSNTLYFGALPPGKVYAESKPVQNPVILDWDVSHPLMQFIRDLSAVAVLKAVAVEPPPGAIELIKSNTAVLAFVAPREGFSDVVVTFPLMDGQNFNTNWFRYISFPLFLFNTLQTLGNARDAGGEDSHAPGLPITLRVDEAGEEMEVVAPSGRVDQLKRTSQGQFVYNGAGKTGVYHARWGKDGALAFAVNLFNERESDLATRGLVPEGTPPEQTDQYKIKIGYSPVAGSSKAVPERKDDWWWLALAALAVVIFEWYVYNRRVYL